VRLGITGHRGLPEAVARRVRAALAAVVSGYDPNELVGVSCLADGPDSWFAEAVLDHGGRLEAVIPAADYRAGLPEPHRGTYDALLGRAREVHTTGLTESDSRAHQTGSEALVDTVDLLVAVWDGLPARGFGGTADAVAYAERTGVPCTIIWPPGATRD